jgi:predicted nucleic-acid-binding protein
MKANPETITLDANVILRYLLNDDAVQSAKASKIMEMIQDERIVAYSDPVTLAEVVWVLSTHYGISRDQIVAGIVPLIKAPCFVLPDKDRYLNALRLFASTSVHFGDACACAAALASSGGRIFSFDQKLSRLPGIQRIESVGGTSLLEYGGAP